MQGEIVLGHKKYSGRAPAYVRLRVEYCASRISHGNAVKTYLSKSFVLPGNYMDAVLSLIDLYNAPPLTYQEEQRLRKAVRRVERQALEDLPPDIDLDQLIAKRKQVAKRIKMRFKQDDLVKVFKRIPLRDFQTYPGSIQRHLVKMLAYKDKLARVRLTDRGFRWSTYIKGKPETLFLANTNGWGKPYGKRN